SPANPSIALGTSQQFTATGTFTDGSTQDLTSTVTGATDANSVATIKAGLAQSAGMGTATITATSGTVSGSTDLTVTAAALVSIAISPPTATTPVGTTQQFTATGTFTDGTTQDLTTTGHWTSSNLNVATISVATGTAGLATAAAQGATSVGLTSGSVSASPATLIVSPAALASLSIAPQSPTIALGLNQQFTASGTYTDGTTQDLTSTVTWASSDATVAIVSNALGSYGLANSSGPGSCTISATSGAVSSSTSITVGSADLVSVSVSPSTASVAVGYGEQFTATAAYTDGSTKDITQTATWTSSAPTVASVNASGYAISVISGVATISASSAGMSGGAVLTVTQAVPVALTISPANATIYAGSQQQLTATLLYSDGSSLNVTSAVAWTSSNPAAATVSAAGLVIGIAGGTATISGSSNSLNGASTLTIQGFGVAITPGSGTIAIGGTQQFTATVYGDSNQAVTWSVDGVQGGNSASGLGMISATRLYTAPPAPATHTITAASQDNSSNS